MEQYILKSTLVAEIKSRIDTNETCQKISGGHEFYRGAIDEAKEILSIINSLELKEVQEDPYVIMGKTGKFITTTK